MVIKKLIRISRTIYLLTLTLAIPFYLFLYLASGHQISFTTEDTFWMVVIIGAILTVFINRRMNILISRILAGLFAVVIFYGAIGITWSQLNFTYGNDVGLFTIVFFSSWPIVFLVATGIYIYSLFEL